MEKFLNPINKTKFVEWLLKLSLINKWTVVLEYSRDNANIFFDQSIIRKNLPKTSINNYDNNCKLVAIDSFDITDTFITQILTLTHTLSVHNQNEMVFLIADNFDNDCFSSSNVFFDKYHKILFDNNLVD